MEFDAAVQQARQGERHAIRARELLETAAEAQACLPALDAAIAARRAELADLDARGEALRLDIAALTQTRDDLETAQRESREAAARDAEQATRDAARRIADLEREHAARQEALAAETAAAIHADRDAVNRAKAATSLELAAITDTLAERTAALARAQDALNEIRRRIGALG